MPTGLKRYHHSGQFHFLTFSCYRRRPLLATAAAKHTLERTLEDTRARQGLLVIAYVLMPEHIHLLTDEPEQGTIATFLQILKQRSSQALKSPEEDQFWQRRYYDRNVRIPEEATEKISYIHHNPVKRGLAVSPEDYTWSSASAYLHGDSGAVRLHLAGASGINFANPRRVAHS